MEIMYLQQLTKFKNSEEGYAFTPLNVAIQYFDSEYKERESLDFAKILLVLKHLELCEKYGFEIKPYYINCFLVPQECKATIDNIYEFIDNSEAYENPEMIIQNLFTREFMEYFEDLETRVLYEAYAKYELYQEAQEIAKEKYNYNIKVTETTDSNNAYNDFKNYIIGQNISVPSKKAKIVIDEINQQEENASKQKTYTKKVTSTPYGE